MSKSGEIVRPESVEEVAETVARAHRDGLTLLPRGSGLHPLPFATPPCDLVVDLTRLNRVVEHSPEDLVASVECGIAFGECVRQLAREGQRIPLDPPAAAEGTLGGLLARNTFGPLRLRHGTARDWLIGSTLVRFDGRVVRAGGMVVKNVSGYDLGKLYVGSWGSLGILVRANFKLAPLPEAEAALAITAERDTAARIVERTRSAHLPLAMAVYLGTELIVVLEGLTGVIDGQRADLERIATDEGGEPAARSVEEAKREALDARHAASRPLLVRLTHPPADGGLVREAIEDALARHRAQRPQEATLLGAGVTWLSWSEPPDDWPTLVDGLRRVCLERSGWLMVERRPDDAPAGFTPWTIPADQRAVMRRLKTALDPDGTFPDVLG